MPGTPTPVPDDPPRPELLLSLPALRARLEEQRQFRIEQIAALSGGDAPDSTPPTGGAAIAPAADSAHSQVTAALLIGARQALADIETALYRILNGQYGTCLQCGAPIDMPRLRTLPQTALCADCHRTRTAGTGPVTRLHPAPGLDPAPVRDPAPGLHGAPGLDPVASGDRAFAKGTPSGQDATLTA
jgi:RNA polymerase-binding transcription factor DksA